MNLHHVGHFIALGYTSGYYPTWKITFTDIDRANISQSSINYIANLIKMGVTEGQVIEDESNLGNWHLEINTDVCDE